MGAYPSVKYEGLTIQLVPGENRSYYLAGTRPKLGLRILNPSQTPRSGTLLLTWNWNFREPTGPTVVWFTLEPNQEKTIPIEGFFVLGDGVVEYRLIWAGPPETVIRPKSPEEVNALLDKNRPPKFEFLGSFICRDPATVRRERLNLALLIVASASSAVAALLAIFTLLLR